MVDRSSVYSDAVMNILQWILCFTLWVCFLQEVGGLAGLVANAKRRGKNHQEPYMSYSFHPQTHGRLTSPNFLAIMVVGAYGPQK